MKPNLKFITDQQLCSYNLYWTGEKSDPVTSCLKRSRKIDVKFSFVFKYINLQEFKSIVNSVIRKSIF